MRYCKRCILPDTRPGLRIGTDGVCSACASMKITSWPSFLRIVAMFRSANGGTVPPPIRLPAHQQPYKTSRITFFWCALAGFNTITRIVLASVASIAMVVQLVGREVSRGGSVLPLWSNDQYVNQ